MRTNRTNQKKKKKDTGCYRFTSKMRRLLKHNQKIKEMKKIFKIKL